jgi:hypothetical protein
MAVFGRRHGSVLELLGGKFKAQGMASFKDLLTPDQVAAIHAFVIARAPEDWHPDFLHPRRQRQRDQLTPGTRGLIRPHLPLLRVRCRIPTVVGATPTYVAD